MSSSDAKRQRTSESPVSRFMDRFREAKEGVRADNGQLHEEANTTDAPEKARWPLPGLAPMTRVETSFGKVHAVALRKGDPVKTKSGEFRKIVWLNRVLLEKSLLDGKPDANPVRIAAGALGPASPSRDIMVSPRQQVCPGPEDRLRDRVEAAELEGYAGIERQLETGLSYTMFHLGEPAEVECDGAFLMFEPPRKSREH